MPERTPELCRLDSRAGLLQDQLRRDDESIDEEAAHGHNDVGGVSDDCDDADDEDTNLSVFASPFLVYLTLIASISGMLFGLDTAVISAMLVSIGSDLTGIALLSWQKELIVASTTCGALLGGLAAGVLADAGGGRFGLGRKNTIAVADSMFVIGAWTQALAGSIPMMVVGRVIVGLGVGIAACVVPLYIAELSPSSLRGRLVTTNILFVTFGQVLAYGIGAALQHRPQGWRWMVGVTSLPALAQLGAMKFLPETPRILIVQGRMQEAHGVLHRIYAGHSKISIERKLQQLSRVCRQSRDAGDLPWTDRLHQLFSPGGDRRALIVGAGLQAFQQLCGFNSLMYFSATLFSALGFRNSTAVSSLVAIINLLFTLVSFTIVDPIGRRRTMLLSAPVMALALFASSMYFRRLTSLTGGRLDPDAHYPTKDTLGAVTCMLVYVAAYATGLGNIPWMQGDAFRLEMRGLGSSICTSVNWLGNLIISATFLSLIDAITPAGAFTLYGVVCIAGWLFCYFCQPETAGLSLEAVCELFNEDFGVKKSLRLRAQLMERRRQADIDRNVHAHR